MQAVILCGGRGTRLSTAYPDRPKALVSVAGKPFLEWQINWLFANNIESITLAAGYMSDQIREWVRQQSFNDRVSVSIEPEPLGTGGAIKHAFQSCEQHSFWVLNGDSLLPGLNFKNMGKAHRESGATGTIAITSIEDSGRYGTVLFDKKGKISKFSEKGKNGAGWINGGVYLLEPLILTLIESGINISIETELFPRLVAEGKLFVFQSKPPLLDMGTPEGLKNMAAYLRKTY